MAEEIGLHLVFEERKTRGRTDVQCGVAITGEGIGLDVSDFFGASSWGNFVQMYPTLAHVLKKCTTLTHWYVGRRDINRELYIETIEGHEGLYEYKGEVRVHC